MKSKNVHVSERIRRMKEAHYPIRLEHPDYSVAQISEMFGVHGRTAINHLAEIAEENGVHRDALLKCPHKKHSPRGKNVAKKSVNEELLLQAVQNAMQEIDAIIDSIDEALEDNNNLMEEQ